MYVLNRMKYFPGKQKVIKCIPQSPKQFQLMNAIFEKLFLNNILIISTIYIYIYI